MKKLSCLLGNCHYADSNLEVEYIGVFPDGFLFRAKNRCVDCGKPYEALFRVMEDQFTLTREVSP